MHFVPFFQCIIALTAASVGFGAESIKVTTYNAALFFEVPFVAERFTWFSQNLLQEMPDSDVICFQEIWGHSFLLPFIQLLSPVYPYSYSMLDEERFNGTQMVCELDTVIAFNECMLGPGQGCDFTSSDMTFPACLTRSCEPFNGGNIWDTIRDSGCQECVTGNLLQGTDFNTAISLCMATPAQGFEPTYGLLIVSKTPITNTRYVQHVGFASKGALKGDVSGVQYICTHLVNSYQWALDGSERRDDVSDQQITQLNDAIALLNPGNKNAVIAGDLNSSPSGGVSFSEINPATYNYLQSIGFMERYSKNTALPTFDTIDNLLIQPSENADPRYTLDDRYIFDHIFVRSDASLCIDDTMRIFEETVVPTEYGNVHPSDHQGQLATIARDSCEKSLGCCDGRPACTKMSERHRCEDNDCVWECTLESPECRCQPLDDGPEACFNIKQERVCDDKPLCEYVCGPDPPQSPASCCQGISSSGRMCDMITSADGCNGRQVCEWICANEGGAVQEGGTGQLSTNVEQRPATNIAGTLGDENRGTAPI